MNRILLILAMAMCAFRAAAQTDPTLAGMILMYEDKAKSQLKAQERAMALQTTGHIWLKEECEDIAGFQRQFNDYLDSFNSAVAFAAQIYGFCHEAGMLTENMGRLTSQIRRSPGNLMAVALTPRRNAIYRELVLCSADIVNDIRQACVSEAKMTEQQRVEIVFGLRPKLKLFNRKLNRLALAVKYTSLSDVWREIDIRASSLEADKGRITGAAMRRWRGSGKKAVAGNPAQTGAAPSNSN